MYVWTTQYGGVDMYKWKYFYSGATTFRGPLGRRQNLKFSTLEVLGLLYSFILKRKVLIIMSHVDIAVTIKVKLRNPQRNE